METLGKVTKTVFLKLVGGEGAIFEGFVADSDLIPGQKVKLKSDGKVQPLAKGDAEVLSVGTVIKGAKAGYILTVQTKFKSIITGSAKADMTPGPIALDSYSSGVAVVAAFDVAHPELVIGYALTPALADADISVGII